MKNFHALACLAATSIVAFGCGGSEDDGAFIGSDLVIPRGILSQDISQIQVLALSNGSGRNVEKLLEKCQGDNLGNAFSKSDLVKLYDDGDEHNALSWDLTASDLAGGVKLNLEVETGTNYLFVFEVIGTNGDGTQRVVANGSAIYEKVSKGKNKGASVHLYQVEPALDCEASAIIK